MDKPIGPLYHYVIDYNKNIESELIDILKKIKPLTIEVRNLPYNATNIFATYLTNKYCYNTYVQLYTRKSYIEKNEYIYVSDSECFHGIRYNGSYNNKNSDIDKQDIRKLTPIILLNHYFTRFELDDCNIIPIRGNKITSIYIIEEKIIRTKAATQRATKAIQKVIPSCQKNIQ